MTDTFYALLAISMVLVVVSLLVPVAERFRLPHTVLLAIAGMGMGFLGSWMITSGVKLGALGDAFVGLDKLEVGADMFLPLFLPPLLFTAGLNIEVRRLMDEVHAVLLLAIVAVVVCIASVGFVVHWATGMDLVVCLLLGAVVSTTDPAAVIGIFRDVGAPKRLSILAEGELLLNDAVAIAAFGLFIGILVSRGRPQRGHARLRQWRRAGLPARVRGRPAAGLPAGARRHVHLAATGRIGGGHRFGDGGTLLFLLRDRRSLSARLGRRLDRDGGADGRCLRPHAPAPAPVVVAKRLWEQLEFWASCLIFVLASMLAANVLLQITWLYFLAVAAVAVGAFVARGLVVFGMLPVLEKVHLVQPVDNRYKAILVWGGLRGAVTIVLAMVAAGNDKLPEDTREFIALSATLFVLFTLFVNATTLGLFMHALGLDKLSRLELALRDRVLALSKVNVDRHLAQIIRRRTARIEGLAADPASAGEAEVEAVPADLALDLDERVKVGLVTLCTREKELYLEQFEQQILSRRMVAVLTADADRLIDSVRDKGVAGYEEWLVDISRPDLGFRVPCGCTGGWAWSAC